LDLKLASKRADVTVKNILRSIKNIVLQTDTSWKMKINILNLSGLIRFDCLIENIFVDS